MTSGARFAVGNLAVALASADKALRDRAWRQTLNLRGRSLHSVGTVAGAGNAFVTPVSIGVYAPRGAGGKLRSALGTYWSMWQLAEPPLTDDGGPGRPASDRMLVVSTARGIGDWIGHVSLAGAPGQVSWTVYSRALPLESVSQSQVVLVCVADAAHLLARAGTAFWARVALDKSAIGDELLDATPELTSMLGSRASMLIV